MALEALKKYANGCKNETQGDTEKQWCTAQKKAESDHYKNEADYVMISEQLRAKISKDIAKGANEHSILIDALKCISLMTGDVAFYEANIKQLGK